MNKQILIKNASIVDAVSEHHGCVGDILLENGKIRQIGAIADYPPDAKIIEGTDCFLIPGLMQAHIHLCQTLFRGLAEDLPLLAWLKEKIWRMEAAHDEETLYHSSMLGLAEMIQSGVTSFLSMETVHCTDSVFQAAEESGLRCYIGNALMDKGEDIPPQLYLSQEESLKECQRLIEKYHNRDDGRINYALAPRFALSTSLDLHREIGKIAQERSLLIHSHAAENRQETSTVADLYQSGNIELFDRLGLAAPNLCLAHCIWLKENEYDLLSRSGVKVLHCPGSNLKLGSGIADIVKMRKMNINIGLGSDGTACNNTLDPFMEMRLAGYLQNLQHHPGALLAKEIFRMMTFGGAECFGIEHLTGSIKEGKAADLVLLDRNSLNTTPQYNADPFTEIVYSIRPENVKMTIAGGRILYDRDSYFIWDESTLRQNAEKSRKKLLSRI